jgi:Zn-dependent metalloprotease
VRGRFLLVALAAGAIVLLTGCDRPQSFEEGEGPVAGLTILQPSSTWQSSAQPADVAQRLSQLQSALEDLREQTGAPWVGRQDDQTGYLTELSGGRWAGTKADEAARGMLETFAQPLFGVPATQIALTTQEVGATKVTTLRAEQRVGDVRVVDGALVFIYRDGAVIAARGRVFPGVAEDTTPVVTPAQARRQAEKASKGDAQLPPELVILPPSAGATDTGTLAWQVYITASRADVEEVTFYFVDALRGGVVATRPGSAELMSSARPARSLAGIGIVVPKGEPVEVTGTSPQGKPITAMGLRTPDGRVVLADTTTPGYDPATGAGGIYTFMAAGTDGEFIPGTIVSSADTTFTDADAIGVHAYMRYVYDYFLTEHGRNSWDGAGGPIVVSLGFGAPDRCNASFRSPGIEPPQMVFSGPCIKDGQRMTSTMVDIDVAAHELTHGVTRATSDLKYSGQSGAINEAFSDYFGAVIGNKFIGQDTASIGEGLCIGIPGTSDFCTPDPSGARSTRYLPNGTNLDDYVRIIDPSLFSKIVLKYSRDHGGVHSNSAIWNNVTWTIRTELAKIDGTTGIESPLAKQFDSVVYATLTSYLTPTSGFLDAATGLQAAARDLGVDPTVQRVIAEQLQFNKFCQGCTTPPLTGTTVVDPSVRTHKQPSVAGSRVTWLQFSTNSQALGTAMVATVGEPSAPLPGDNVAFTGFAGPDAVLTGEPDFTAGTVTLRRHDLITGTSAVVAEGPDIDFFYLAGSDAGAAWFSDGEAHFLAPDGTVTSAAIPASLAGPDEGISTVATGGGMVALGGTRGTVILWEPGSAPRALPQRLPDYVIELALDGDVVAAAVLELPRVSSRAEIYVIAGEEQPRRVSEAAVPFGIAVEGQYVVWPEVLDTEVIPGRVNEADGYLENDLHLHSVATKRTFRLLRQPGDQGYPAMSGNRLVWQDAILAGNNIFTANVPDGL